MALVRSLGPTEGFMCPRSWGPDVDPLHAVANRVKDAFYKASTINDEDGEFAVPEVGIAYQAADQGLSDYMNLYVDAHTVTADGVRLLVRTAMWQCQTCGFVLPAAGVDRV